MENHLKHRSAIVVLIVFMTVMQSCENVFHNDRLDYMWRLDSVEYIDGVDFDGVPCDVEKKSGCWFSFARNLVQLDNRNSYFGAIGVLTDNGDTLTFDFSMCDKVLNLDSELKKLGIGSRVSDFTVVTLNCSKMVLSGSETVLSFTKW